MAELAQRFFCHQCSVEIPNVGPDFTCPTCLSGFIEEVPEGRGHANPAESHDDMDDIAGLPFALFGGLPVMQDGPHFPHRSRVQRPQGGRRRPDNIRDRWFEQFLQNLIMNAAGGGGGMPPPGLQIHVIPGSQGVQIGMPGIQLHGNPGDYAWGRGGLDAIITQLLNQMDGAGPPPMAQENIQDIPSVQLTQILLDRNPNCSVCWEDYKLNDEVKKLECQHCFHPDCIVPWLQLHGTCPVCRKVLSGGTEGRPSGGPQRDRDPSEPEPDTDSDSQDVRLPRQSSERGAAGLGSRGSMSRGGSHQDGAPGVMGFIQSAISQALESVVGWSPSASGASSPTMEGSSSASFSSGSSYSQGRPTSSSGGPDSSSSSSGTRASSSTSTAVVSTPSSQGDEDEEDGTPATRRQRLDSDLIDLDLE